MNFTSLRLYKIYKILKTQKQAFYKLFTNFTQQQSNNIKATTSKAKRDMRENE